MLIYLLGYVTTLLIVYTMNHSKYWHNYESMPLIAAVVLALFSWLAVVSLPLMWLVVLVEYFYKNPPSWLVKIENKFQNKGK